MKRRPANLPFKIGQMAEARSFDSGYRGAWFLCQIIRINQREKVYTLEYPHFPDEGLERLKLYQSRLDIEGNIIEGTEEMMIRPCYPTILSKKQKPRESEIPEVAVIVDNVWKVGDLVDWWKDDCYWSGTIIQLLGDGKAKIQLKPEPLGEGTVDEIQLKDIRPSLDWSLENGWTLPTQDEDTGRPCAVLIRPGDQVQDTHHAGHEAQNPAESITMPSLTSSPSSGSEPHTLEKMQVKKRSLEDIVKKTTSADRGGAVIALEAAIDVGTQEKATSANLRGGCPMELEGTETNSKQSHVRVHDDLDKSCPAEKVRDGEGVLLPSLHSHSAEAAIVGLEACLTKIKHLKSLLLSVASSSDATMVDAWELLETNCVSSRSKYLTR